MRLFFLYAIFALIFAFIFNSCENATQNQPVGDYGPQAVFDGGGGDGDGGDGDDDGTIGGEQTDPPATTGVNLIAGQHTRIGTVGAAVSGTSMTVTYTCTEEGWNMYEIHFHVANSVDDIPANKKGNPKVGKFMEKFEDLDTDTYSFVFDVSDLDLESTLYFAAHAAVSNGESAWGEGTRFVQRGNWAMYFTDEEDD